MMIESILKLCLISFQSYLPRSPTESSPRWRGSLSSGGCSRRSPRPPRPPWQLSTLLVSPPWTRCHCDRCVCCSPDHWVPAQAVRQCGQCLCVGIITGILGPGGPWPVYTGAPPSQPAARITLWNTKKFYCCKSSTWTTRNNVAVFHVRNNESVFTSSLSLWCRQ